VFKERTTITIAHRLDTIIFSDRILAMAAGELKVSHTVQPKIQEPKSLHTSP
jgi:ABC-type transport system involved in Fe-S cluster assembly fused permease/ATPase subunit